MTASLFAGTRYVELLGTLPANAERDDLHSTLLKRERQLDTVLNRAADIDRRVQTIANALPDANAKERTELLAERRDLLAKRDGLPLDVTVSARLYANAVADFTEAVHGAIATEMRAVRDELDKTAKALHAARHDVENAAPHLPQFEPPYERLKEVIATRQPHTDRADELKELGELTVEYARHVLHDGAAATGHQAVKLAHNRPIDAHIEGFVDAARRKVVA